jgi:hypothetical protein
MPQRHEAMGCVRELKWIIQHRRGLRQHVLDMRPLQGPTDNWWVLAASLLPVFETLATTFTILQARNMVISQQRHEMEALVGKVCSGIGLRSSLDGSLEGFDPDTIVSNGDWWIARDSICDHMHDQGSWVRDMFEGLGDPAKSKVVHEIGLFALTISVEGSVVLAERDGNNNPLDIEAPPVMPADICKLPTRTFVKDVLDRFRGHIKKYRSEENIDAIEDDHKVLIQAAKNDDAIKKILEGHDEKVFFNDAWDAISSKRRTVRSDSPSCVSSVEGPRPPSRTRARWNRTSPCQVCCKTGVRQSKVPRDGPRRSSCPQSLRSREMATSLTGWRI